MNGRPAIDWYMLTRVSGEVKWGDHLFSAMATLMRRSPVSVSHRTQREWLDGDQLPAP